MADRTFELAIIVNAIDKASGVLGGLGGNLQKLGGVALGLGGAAAAGVGAMGAALTKLAIDAAPIEGIKEAFEGVAEVSGKSADAMLAALQKGSSGMVAQRDLMKSYNTAAQLVGTTFANQLPDAMGYLSKVSAATGQDMGFMLDSLVKGVGRLSPMILDNLGIQVQLTEATDKASQMYGVAADALTKEQNQAGMMAVVMEKLAANTAAMPDVAGSAAQQVAEMGAKFQDFKDNIGMALLPALSDVAGTLLDLADKVLPVVVSFMESSVVPIVEKLAGAFGTLISALLEGNLSLGTLQEILAQFLPPELVDSVMGFAASVQSLIETVAPYIEQVAGWIGEHVKLQDVLIALGIAIASVVIPAIVSLIASAAPIVAVFVGLVAAAALLRQAWESDFLGIQEIVAAAGNLITGVIAPAIQTALDYISTVVIPVLRDAFEMLWTKVMGFWTGFWDGFRPALERMYGMLTEFWTDIQPSLMEAWEALNELWNTVVGIWRDVLQPALDRLITALGLGGDETSEFGEKVGALVGLLLEAGLEDLIISIAAAIEGFVVVVTAITDAFNFWKNAILAVQAALNALSVPEAVMPGSPSPLEASIVGINDALMEMARLAARVQFPQSLSAGAQMAAAPVTTYNYVMNVSTRATAPSVVQDFGILRAISGGR